MTDPQKLLVDYVENGSETAFREIVSRYINLVYSVAVRLVDGDTHLAEDVAQNVFIDLARQSRKLSRDTLLGGWLHRHTCFVAAKAMRSNRRRQSRERQAVEMNAHEDHSEENLAHVAPILDEAINQLREPDRLAILLRFFEQQDLRSVGEAMGASENAAQKRVSRALDELRGLLKHRGVALSGAGLATALAGGGVAAAPAGLAVNIASAALTSVAAGSGTSLTLFKIMTMTKLKTGLIGALAVVGVATPLVLQHRAQDALRRENQNLRQRIAQMDQVNTESERLLNLFTNNTRLAQDQLSDLMRLRAEVGTLRKQAGDVGRLRDQNRQLQAALAGSGPGTGDSEPEDPAMEEQRREGLAKLNFTKTWLMAFYLYSEKNGGNFPESFEQARPFLPEMTAEEQGGAGSDARLAEQLNPDRYEIFYHGPLTNISNPATLIVLREKEAWPNVKGGWNRSYGFADGHSEIHKATDGNFEPWEKERLVSSPASSLSGSVQ